MSAILTRLFARRQEHRSVCKANSPRAKAVETVAKRRCTGAGLAALALVCSGVLAEARAATPAEDFARFLRDAWEFDLREDPLFATKAGDHRYNDRLPRESLQDQRRRAAQRAELLKTLRAIDRSQLPRDEQTNYDVADRKLNDELGEARFQAYLTPITNREGFHISFPDLPKEVPLNTVDDYNNYLARLRAFPAYVDDHVELMREGIRQKALLPGIVLEAYRDPIATHLVDDPTSSLFFAPFTRFPAAVDAAQRQRLAREGREAITSCVVPAYRKFLEFMEREYVPSARPSIGASALPEGRPFYQHRTRLFTTLDVTPEEVHATGLKEVARIRAEMEAIVKKVNFQGDFAQFLEFLRNDPKFYARSPDELKQAVALILKRMDGELPRLFKTLPRTPYGIREIPAYIAPRTTSAYYSPPAGDGSRAGFYFLNTYNLKSRPLYEMEALSLHEAVPGHHLQIALQQERADLPNFRRFTSFTAYVEGWALYSERLGLEVDFYQDPYSDFGRLGFEMWRACRLVVDTGMHYLDWPRERAIEFMAENTALSRHNIVAEVDRYIAWPGQALGYKMGEIKIRELRARAESALGSKFDLREFHDVVLRSGAVPLDLLERNVNAYIGQQ
ncbi:MAG: DUF885 domain-containing protein [Planctomycetes bacterium]|nr:DUF885 domain-containing protein [Planctomycetota bacterium]